ncbi:MAG: hypothetical protein P4M07_08320 [Xanthobacteraceae bacterium]|nr:hypothetical protein [Xanthobacteraceae bacterium]
MRHRRDEILGVRRVVDARVHVPNILARVAMIEPSCVDKIPLTMAAIFVASSNHAAGWSL